MEGKIYTEEGSGCGGHEHQREHQKDHDGDCGCGAHEHGMHGRWQHHGYCGCGCHQRHGGMRFHRRFVSREEIIGNLEGYLKQLQAEEKGVAERIAELKKQGESPQA